MSLMPKAERKCTPENWQTGPAKTIKKTIFDEGGHAAQETSQCRCRCAASRDGRALSDGRAHWLVCTADCDECPTTCNKKKAHYSKAFDLFPDAFVCVST